MKLYRFKSQALREYASGDALVVAGSLEEARRVLRAGFPQHLDEEYPWWDMSYEEDKEDRDNLLKQFDRDLLSTPEITTSGVYIRGSE